LPLAGRAARFYLSQSRLSAAGEDFISAYLWANPRDEEVAEQWVQHAERQGRLRDEHQDLADRLGNAHPRNAAIQREVARLYLALERTDYPALQTYRRLCAEGDQVPPEFCSDLSRLLRRDGRSDEWMQPFWPRRGQRIQRRPNSSARDAPNRRTSPTPTSVGGSPVDRRPSRVRTRLPDVRGGG